MIVDRFTREGEKKVPDLHTRGLGGAILRHRVHGHVAVRILRPDPNARSLLLLLLGRPEHPVLPVGVGKKGE